MKKLMIAAAIVCAAVASQAASLKWTSANIKDINGDAYNGYAKLIITDTNTGVTNDKDFGATFSGGKVQAVVIGDQSAADAGFIVSGHTYNAYFTMTDANGNVYTSSTKTGVTANFPAQVALGIQAGSWTPAPVPEPTSGLLLLLGVAGMALRRRRA